MPKNTVICFDLFNTLATTTPPPGGSYEDRLVALGAPCELIYPYVRDYLMTSRHSYGVMVQMLIEFFSLTASTNEQHNISKAWGEENASARWITGIHNLLRQLRPFGPVLLVSNCTFPGWRTVDKRLKLTKRFDNSYCSFACGMAKPDPRVWQRITRDYPTRDHEYWMVGDSEADDLAVPRAFGWQTHLAKPDGSTLPDLITRLKER